MGQARQFSSALRSSNRYYLNQTGGSVQQKIFSVAKYDSANASPAQTRRRFRFHESGSQQRPKREFQRQHHPERRNLFGIKRGRDLRCAEHRRLYSGSIQIDRRTIFLNRKTGDQLLDNGLFVAMKKVPADGRELGHRAF